MNFTYNSLNLLNGVSEGSTVRATYTWLADGTKLRVRDAGGNGFDYMGSLTYSCSGGTNPALTLETAQFAGGAIRMGQSGQEIEYHLTDHLGSVRVIVDASGNIREQNDYYPFGARQVIGTYAQSANRLKYNGKLPENIFIKIK